MRIFEKSLLERVEHPESAIRSTLKIDASALADSIMLNLRELFNARQGSVLMRPDYGMPDFNDLSTQFPDAIPVIGRAIKYQIETFEPRLGSVAVKHVPDPDNPLALCYQIAAEIRLGDEAERVRFETILGDDGHVRVRN